jgi:hypothetical protein
VQEHKPHAIVVGASHPEARNLEQDLGAIREHILLENPRFQIGGCCCGEACWGVRAALSLLLWVPAGLPAGAELSVAPVARHPA